MEMKQHTLKQSMEQQKKENQKGNQKVLRDE